MREEEERRREVRVGDLVRIKGWMKVVALLPATNDSVRFSVGGEGEGEGGTGTTVWETRRCVWEIHVHKIERPSVEEQPFVAETVHWLECLTFLHRLENDRVDAASVERGSGGDDDGSEGTETDSTTPPDDDAIYRHRRDVASTPV